KKRLLLSYCHIKQELKLFTTRTYKMDILSDRNMLIKVIDSLKKQQEKTTSERNVKNLKQLFADDATNSREKIFLVVSLIKLPPIPEDGKVPPITIKRKQKIALNNEKVISSKTDVDEGMVNETVVNLILNPNKSYFHPFENILIDSEVNG
ncbi:hypothetical protein Avbf_11701, partial [Armadillidium vulgare]